MLGYFWAFLLSFFIILIAQEIIVILSKGDGNPITIIEFQVQKGWTTHEVNTVVYRKWKKLIYKAKSAPKNANYLVIKITS